MRLVVVSSGVDPELFLRRLRRLRMTEEVHQDQRLLEVDVCSSIKPSIRSSTNVRAVSMITGIWLPRDHFFTGCISTHARQHDVKYNKIDFGIWLIENSQSFVSSAAVVTFRPSDVRLYWMPMARWSSSSTSKIFGMMLIECNALQYVWRNHFHKTMPKHQ